MLTINLDVFKVREKDVVLDAGCGDGRHVLAIAKMPCRLVALDTSWIDLLKVFFVVSLMNHKGELKAYAEVVRGDVRRLPFKENSFTKVICTEVLEHIKEDREAIGELARVTDGKGCVAVSVPTRASERLYGRLSAKYFRSPGGHIKIYREDKLLEKLKEGGLRPVRVYYEHALHTVYWLLKCLAGLDNDKAIIPALWRLLLIYSPRVKLIRIVEKFFNYVFPKSVVFYLKKKTANVLNERNHRSV